LSSNDVRLYYADDSLFIVLELCGGELKEISSLEMLKRDDLQFEIVDEDEEDAAFDELDMLDLDDDDDDEYYA
jgi:hypothetical protein